MESFPTLEMVVPAGVVLVGALIVLSTRKTGYDKWSLGTQFMFRVMIIISVVIILWWAVTVLF